MHLHHWKILSIVLSALLLTSSGVQGLAKVHGPYNDEKIPPVAIMLLSAEEVPNYLDYRGSSLTPVVRVKVSYREIDKNRNNTEEKYEDLWYANGKPVGLVRYRPLALYRSQIMVRVDQQRLQECEIDAIANSIIRVYLDAALNDDTIYSCVVPDDSFHDVLSAFQLHQFYSPGSPDVSCPLDPAISLMLHAATSGQNRVVQFARM